VRGTPRRLAPEASLAVLRAAQEALANARKHAPGAAVVMTLCFEEQATLMSWRPPLVPEALGLGSDHREYPLVGVDG
jgi:hypothetical protein